MNKKDYYRCSHKFADVILCKDKENHYLDIKQEILRRQFVGNSETERPVLVFSIQQQLSDIHESTPAVERDGLVRNATNKVQSHL
jgi:hypothetical protein